MSSLDRLIPAPRHVEVDSVDVAAPPDRVWNEVRHGDLGRSPLVRALFRLRTREAAPALRLDALRSTAGEPGFQILSETPPSSVTAGAIGQVWKLDIPFVHVPDADAFRAFDAPGEVKVAWAIDLEAIDGGTRVWIEVRVDATDDDAWKKFRRYFHVIGPASRFIRRSLLSALRRELGPAGDETRALAGDERMDARAQSTHAITIAAPPEAIWPWLVQMGCRRGGFYAIDLVDNDGEPSAREIHPDLQDLAVGDVVPATPDGKGSFEVLRLEPGRALVLGALTDSETGTSLPFAAPDPDRFWRVTWSFVLEPVDAGHTRLVTRARASFSDGRLRLAWIRPVHHLMETVQLRRLRDRAEGRLARDRLRDVAEGLGGAAIIAADLLTPFLRPARSHWGLDEQAAQRAHPGDDLVPMPRWQWTHAIEIERSCARVWPWIAQLGADRAGFYSYQWLENLAGCALRNAEAIHPEWALREGDALVLHPKMPPLRVVSLEPERGLVAYAAPDERAREEGRPWAAVTWAFLLEPLGRDRCRLVSRYRCATSDDLATRLSLGPTVVEPIGFAMDRRMLFGVKERAERQPSL
jgi:hypothetical protein